MVFASDSNPLCAESYKANFDSTEFVLAPIEDLDEEHLAPVLRQPVDLLAGGPPCPPFSKSRFYLPDKPRALDDPLAAATLTGYLRVLKIVRPRAFLLENVPGLRYRVHGEALRFLVSGAHKLGYETSTTVVNAADYGVPQTRERLFMLGSLHGRVMMPSATHAASPEGALPVGIRPWRTAGEVLCDLDTDEYDDLPGHAAGGQYHDLLKQVPPGENYLFFTEERGHPQPQFEWRSRYWSFLLKLSPDRPSWTIQARRSNNMGPFHWRNRILRIEEVKRLQSFPDGWLLSGGVSEQWRQLGNAVPPLLAEAIGRQLREHLTSVRDNGADGRVGRVAAARETVSRKVGTPQGRVPVNGRSGRLAGQCHREQTADGDDGETGRSTGKGETVR